MGKILNQFDGKMVAGFKDVVAALREPVEGPDRYRLVQKAFMIDGGQNFRWNSFSYQSARNGFQADDVDASGEGVRILVEKNADLWGAVLLSHDGKQV